MTVLRDIWLFATLGILLALAAACGQASTGVGEEAEALPSLALPELAPVHTGATRPLRVVATTGIIGDVVAHVGGDQIVLTILMGPGQDPHSYEPSTADLTRVAEADVIFVNGWDLEEGLVDDLANIAGDAPLIPVSAGIAPLFSGAHDREDGPEHENERDADPHVWLDPQNVRRWVQNIEQVLGNLDPANAGAYAASAQTFEQELAALEAAMEAQLAQIPDDRRKLVTNHDALAYFARRFDFQIVGTVIPAASTMAEPSAREMVTLVQNMRAEGVCAIFAESTSSVRLAETVAAELDNCDEVQVLSLYTGALGPPGSGAGSYLDMMRANTDAIVRGLGTGQ